MSQYGEKSGHISRWNGARTTVTLSEHLNDHVILEDTKGPIKKRVYGAMPGDNEELIFSEDMESHRVLL